MENDVLDRAYRRIGAKAGGLRSLSNVLEVIGWISVVGGAVVGVVIATQETTQLTTDFSGDLAFESTRDVANGIAIGIALMIAALAEVAIARAMGLFAEYAAARTGTDLDGSSGGGGSTGTNDWGGWYQQQQQPQPSGGPAAAAQALTLADIQRLYPREYAQAVEQLDASATKPADQDAWLVELVRRIRAGSPPAAAAETISREWERRS